MLNRILVDASLFTTLQGWIAGIVDWMNLERLSGFYTAICGYT